MNVLVGCEYSGIVREAFSKRGHNAVSCDIIPTEIDGQHYQGDIIEFLRMTDGYWDLGIFHPPCTYLTNAGVCHLYKGRRKPNGIDKDRWSLMCDGAQFFLSLLNANIPKICVENPVMHGYGKDIIGRKQDQIVQPWMFGHKEKKATCFWLKGLPKLVPSTNLKKETDALPKKEQQRLHYLSPSEDRGKLRSLTYTGIAEQMANQWG